MLKIVVCLKQVLDTEAPASAYKVDTDGKHVALRGVPPVINPFDENAMEAAIRIKASRESRIIGLSLGKNLSRPLLRKALAYGADELVLVEDELLADPDTYTTSCLLAAAIKKIGAYDLVLTGREAADSNAGMVGSGIAEILGINNVNIARKVEVIPENKVLVQRIISDGYEEMETVLPALVTVSNEMGSPKSPTVQEMMAAQKKPITVWKVADLGVTMPASVKGRLLGLSIPKREVKCELAAGETPEEKGANLAVKLREAKVI